MRIIFLWQILQKITRLNKSSLKNQNYILLVGCQLIKTLLLTFLYQNAEGKKALSNILITCAEENSKFNLDLKTYKKIFFDINMPFVKRGDTLLNLNIMMQLLKKNKQLSFTTIATTLKILVLRGNTRP